MKYNNLNTLKKLFKDEDEAWKEYSEMAREARENRDIEISIVFESMSLDERKHRKLIDNMMRKLKRER